MRRIMVMVMAAVLLAGVMTAFPAAASGDVFTETFEEDWTAVWTVAEGNAENVSQVDGGASGKALQLTGSAETDVIKLQKEVQYTGQVPYVITAKYKMPEYVSGNGLRIYMQDTSPNVAKLLGESDYVKAATDGTEYKKLVFGARYYHEAVREAYIVIEYSGSGKIFLDDVALQRAEEGLIPNGDFEADTYSSLEYVASSDQVGLTTLDNNKCVFVSGSGWSEEFKMFYGRAVTPGEKYLISFRYKTESTSKRPAVYLYFGTASQTNEDKNNPAAVAESIGFSYYDPDYGRDTNDGKVIVNPTQEWQTYHAVISIPTMAESEKNYDYVMLNQIGFRTYSHGTYKGYYDDICITAANSRIEYTNTGNSPVESIAAAGETLRTRCFFAKDTAKESETVMLVQAIYAEDGNGTRQLMEVKINSQTVTAKNQYITVDNTIPDADGKTLIAESYLWSGSGSLVPITNEITIK